jgi:hypothetical protein
MFAYTCEYRNYLCDILTCRRFVMADNKKPAGGFLAGLAEVARIKGGQRPFSNSPTIAKLKAIEALKPKKAK